VTFITSQADSALPGTRRIAGSTLNIPQQIIVVVVNAKQQTAA
jgi:hypothetical protein